MIEVTTFRLLSSSSRDAFLLADERLQMEFFYQQPGLIRRTTAVTEDGKWITITHWDSLDHATTAAAKKSTLSNATDADQLIDLTTVSTDHFSTV